MSVDGEPWTRQAAIREELPLENGDAYPADGDVSEDPRGDACGADGDASEDPRGDACGADGDAYRRVASYDLRASGGDVSGTIGDASDEARDGCRGDGAVSERSPASVPSGELSQSLSEQSERRGGVARKAGSLLGRHGSGKTLDPETEAFILHGALLPRLWPLLHARRGRGRDAELIALSLTAPPGCDVRVAMARLAAWVDERQFGGGVLLVVDRAPKDGREHAYGPFVGDGAAVAAYWRHLTGGSPAAAKLRAVRGWPDHLGGDSREMLGNFSHILGYTVRPWPSQHGRRDLERDAVASLAFFRPWRDALASVQPMALMLAQSAYASPTRSEASRICPYCGRAIPPDKRSDSRFCNKQHKANYHRDQKKLAARAANPGAGAAQGGQRDP